MRKIKKIIEMIKESKEKRWDGQLLRGSVNIAAIWIVGFIAIFTDNVILDGLLYGVCLMSIICGSIEIIISSHNLKVLSKECLKLIETAKSTTTNSEEKEV